MGLCSIYLKLYNRERGVRQRVIHRVLSKSGDISTWCEIIQGPESKKAVERPADDGSDLVVLQIPVKV